MYKRQGLLGPQGIGGFLISEKLDAQMAPYLAGGTGSQSDSLDTVSYTHLDVYKRQHWKCAEC